MAEDARSLLDLQGWDSAHVVGHSLGGLVAQHLAIVFRERVRSLSLLCTFARGSDAAPMTPWMMWTGLRTRVGARRLRRNAFLEIVTPPGLLAETDRDALAERPAPLFGHDLADQPAVVAKQLAAMRAYDASARLSEVVNLPTLVVSAEHDPIAPPKLGPALAAAISGARYVEISDASHGVPIHAAERVNELLMEHLAG